MTKQKKLKKRIRARMEKTGEAYTAARAKVAGMKPPDPPRLSMPCRLYYKDAQGRERWVELGAEPLYIGRHVECAIRTADAMVSRRHARVLQVGGRYVIEDNDSANGIYVMAAQRGSLVSEPRRVQRHPLTHNEILRCGSLWLRFFDPDAVSPPGSFPPQPPGEPAVRSLEDEVDEVCQTLWVASNARGVACIDRQGKTIAKCGDTGVETRIAALAKLGPRNLGSPFGVGRLAELLANKEFTSEAIPGDDGRLHLAIVGRYAALAIWFVNETTSLGLVRLRAKKAVEDLERIFRAHETTPEPPPGGPSGNDPAGGVPAEVSAFPGRWPWRGPGGDRSSS
jgi:predicted regulator of Ras-like GTPase activity (Roadblock/LC7/MglB family)